MRRGPRAVTMGASYNWAGYADESTTKGASTKVAGSWTTPTVTCTAEDTITSKWVGLDGASAEWISERSSFSIGIAPLADYGTWKLTNGTETARILTPLLRGQELAG